MSMRAILQRFGRDERGIALVYVTLTLPVLIGFALLAIDLARVNNLHNDLQDAADAYALAAAAELDGSADAITRANRAIDNLLANTSQFSTGGLQTIGADDVTVTYLFDIPEDDSTPLDAAGVDDEDNDWSTTDATEARFAEVTVNPTDFGTIFPTALLGATGTASVGAQAVGGFGSAVCDYTPMFICNPYGSLEAMQEAIAQPNRPMLLLKKANGGNAQYGPGNYGYLDAPDGSRQNKDLAEMFAVPHPRACYSNDGVTTKPGAIPNLADAMNVRFDMYGNGNVSGYKLSPAANPPAPGVRKGLEVRNVGKNNCSYQAGTPAANYMGVPRDNCFASGTCASAGTLPSRVGDGVWNFTAYWNTNWHPDSPNAVNPDHTRAVVRAWCGVGTLDTDPPPSRYCVYQYELKFRDAASVIDGVTLPRLTPVAEATAPQCNATTQSAERRLLYVAVIDCTANPVSGGGGTYPVQAFASMFLTEPVGSSNDADVYGELEDISTAYGNGTLSQFQRDEAQLYR